MSGARSSSSSDEQIPANDTKPPTSIRSSRASDYERYTTYSQLSFTNVDQKQFAASDYASSHTSFNMLQTRPMRVPLHNTTNQDDADEKINRFNSEPSQYQEEIESNNQSQQPAPSTNQSCEHSLFNHEVCAFCLSTTCL